MEEKLFDIDIKVEWGTTYSIDWIDNPTKEDVIKIVKEDWKEQYNIDLHDSEIKIKGVNYGL